MITGDIRDVKGLAHFDKTDGEHFALSVPNREVARLGGGRFRLPQPHGMSGGGVWRLEIDIPNRLAATPLLVGVGIEFYTAKRVFVATRVQVAIPLVRDLMRLSAHLPLESDVKLP